ncbi:MAG: DNA translocase FtsK [Candidatus Hydrogenedentes bacterium]|nr:DNA translocase FtsK [Candidatus Hydrogenedentota bacterium]
MGLLDKLPSERKCEIAGVCLLAFTAFLFLALATDGYQGQTTRSVSDIGAGGSVIAGLLYILIGKAAHIIYLLTGVWGVMLVRHQPVDRMWTRSLGAFLLMVSVAGFLHFHFDDGTKPGGAVGGFVEYLIAPVFGVMGSTVITVTVAIVGLLLATEFLFVRLLHWCWSTLTLMIHSIEDIKNQFTGKFIERHDKYGEGPKVITVRPKPAREESRLRQLLTLFTSKKSKVRKAVKAVREAQRLREEADSEEARISGSASGLGAQQRPDRISPHDPSHSAKEREELGSHAVEVASQEEAQLEFEHGGEPQYITTKAVPDPPKTSEKASLRRKTTLDEIPEDYVYPRRYKKPPLSLFEEQPQTVREDLGPVLRATAKLLEETLETFGIEAKVTDITRGPTITRFELEPASGIKVNRFTALADDLALALKAHGVRVEAPIPGKGKVGIEIPNERREAVVIRELLESVPFRRDEGQLVLAMGKDIAGDPVCADLATMPHLLIAGATGSGKTIYMKTVLASLLVTKSPDELQLMLIDPKMVELSIFNDIPHLITPVVIDPKKAANALSWLINEMEERYRLFAHLRVRNIEVYNNSVKNGEIEIEGADGEEGGNVEAIRKLPYIVCMIDELADLMMLARAEVEDAIARLAQLARAVGIHLIIATQRPSVDVLTGVIKANFPARASFQVSSRVDSRCILDEMGAERLIGNGDMLYLPPGQSKPIRLQSAFMSDEDVEALISYLKGQAPPQYRDEIEKYGQQQDALLDLADEDDELFDDAVRVVTETGQASISMVQRRLRVGYTRAARLIDMMELRGIVGPHLGSKARDILVAVAPDNDEVV